MTGFGRAKSNAAGFDITVEIKAVNHKFFDFNARMPRAYQFLEEKLKSLCNQKVARGKLELSLMIENNEDNGNTLCINRAYADAYISALRELAREYRLKNDVKVSTIASNPEIFSVKKKDIDEEAVGKVVLEIAGEALDNFVAAREVEGQRLVEDILSRTDTILKAVEFVEERSPETVKEYRERLENKIRELIGDTTVDEQRLITETAIFADKVAVAEETVRLRSHISAVRDLFELGGPIGRKLDFIVQEMNRETNTIGSKCQDLDITKTVVDIKAEIEKIREQIQNIE